MPSLAFFTTYALLVLFWAEIYYQVRVQFEVVCFLLVCCGMSVYDYALITSSKGGLLITTLDLNVKQARAASTDGLRPSFFSVNAVVYAVQVKFLAHCFTLSPGKWEVFEVGFLP